MLRRFSARYAGAADAIRASLAAGDSEAAARAAHTLRGVAGNLGALDVAESVSRLEEAIRTQEGIDAAVGSLAAVLEATLAAIHSAVPGEDGRERPLLE